MANSVNEAATHLVVHSYRRLERYDPHHPELGHVGAVTDQGFSYWSPQSFRDRFGDTSDRSMHLNYAMVLIRAADELAGIDNQLDENPIALEIKEEDIPF